jgi:nicotinate-nucleotide adenylyltransferase
MARRIARAQQMIRDPRVAVTGLEEKLGTRYTAQTLERLCRLYPGVRFVWLMGADNLAQFHLWDNWRDIMERVPVGVLARPGARLAARGSVAAEIYASSRLGAEASHMLAEADLPAWCFVNVPMRSQSSSAIRAKGAWVTGDE